MMAIVNKNRLQKIAAIRNAVLRVSLRNVIETIANSADRLNERQCKRPLNSIRDAADVRFHDTGLGIEMEIPNRSNNIVRVTTLPSFRIRTSRSLNSRGCNRDFLAGAPYGAGDQIDLEIRYFHEGYVLPAG